MNRNSDYRFDLAPQVDIERSTFDNGFTVSTSFNCGEIVPFAALEILPGDSYKVKTSKIARMQTLKTPMFGDVFLDTYWFFIPNRLVWQHWQEFMGATPESEWIPEVEYTVPQLVSPEETGWNAGTIADYMGIPIGVPGLSVNALPFRAYSLVYNEWFRSEVLQDPLVIETGDSTVQGSNGSNYTVDVNKGGKPAIACKMHDYFTSALTQPQRGPEVTVPLAQGPLPVFTQGQPNSYYAPLFNSKNVWDDDSYDQYIDNVKNGYPVFYQTPTNNVASGNTGLPGPNIGSVVEIGTAASDQLGYMASNKVSYLNSPDSGVHTFLGVPIKNISFEGTDFEAQTITNLAASPALAYTSINELRKAFQIQRFYEKSARSGCGRYIEILKAHFGVTSPDARLQRPEYLGGSRLNLNVRQITQTSGTTNESPLGDVAGMSVTTDNHYDFDKSFTEHGWLLGVMVARYNHSYQQGVDRSFLRKSKFDYYWPSFAHLGEQKILCQEIFAVGPQIDPLTEEDTSTDNDVFGYQEAWAEYRYRPNRITGLMRSESNSGLDSWHLADDYSQLPYLSSSWIMEDKTNLDRVLTVTSDVSSQIFMDILVDATATRPMPLYSIPGLIDHF